LSFRLVNFLRVRNNGMEANFKRPTKKRRPHKKPKPQLKKKKSNGSSIVIPDYIMKQWVDLISGKRVMRPANCIPIVCLQKEMYSSWLYNTIKSTYRKRKEWTALINDMKSGTEITHTDVPPTLDNGNPFLYKHTIAKHIEKLIHLNTCLYMNILKYVQRRLLKKMEERVVGTDDLNTTVPIPANMLVAVYDFKTRAKYVFHTNTILKMILCSLRYSAYGIPNPKHPKNPYTNLEWTKPQLISITQQIVRNMATVHRIPPPLFLNYYNCNYNIPCFTKFCEKELVIRAAVELFSNKEDYDTREIYGETIDDTAGEIGFHMSAYIRDMIVERKLNPTLQEKWDNLVLSVWIYTNIHVVYGIYDSYDEMIDDFRLFYKESRNYIYSLQNSNRRPRPATVERSNTLISQLDTIYSQNILIIENNEEVSGTANL